MEKNASYRDYYFAHKEEKKASVKAYYIAHKEEKNAADRAYYSEKRRMWLIGLADRAAYRANASQQKAAAM